jgi:hypothetical protein
MSYNVPMVSEAVADVEQVLLNRSRRNKGACAVDGGKEDWTGVGRVAVTRPRFAKSPHKPACMPFLMIYNTMLTTCDAVHIFPAEFPVSSSTIWSLPGYDGRLRSSFSSITLWRDP